jgi:hypothetical protein
MLVLLPLSAYPQTLTGAIQFSTNSTGAFSGGQIWNTLGGDSSSDLWLALNPNATSPVNGPSDAQAGINITLEPLNQSVYTFYIFGQPGAASSYNGLNLFFDGNNSTPGISVFGALNNAKFQTNSSTTTLTLAGGSVAGSGTSYYSPANGVLVMLTGYEWHTPETRLGDVCQAMLFAPGNGADFFGSFTLQVTAAVPLVLSPASGSPGTNFTMTGSGFAPLETVNIYAGQPISGGSPVTMVVTDASGSFTVTIRVPQHPYASMDVYALGHTSNTLGAASFFVTPGLIMDPGSGLPGGATAAQGLGFGAGETVNVYWDSPRLLLGAATANSQGSFVGSSALTITIPANASPGSNVVFGVGQTTTAVGLGKIEVN